MDSDSDPEEKGAWAGAGEMCCLQEMSPIVELWIRTGLPKKTLR